MTVGSQPDEQVFNFSANWLLAFKKAYGLSQVTPQTARVILAQVTPETARVIHPEIHLGNSERMPTVSPRLPQKISGKFMATFLIYRSSP